MGTQRMLVRHLFQPRSDAKIFGLNENGAADANDVWLALANSVRFRFVHKLVNSMKYEHQFTRSFRLFL